MEIAKTKKGDLPIIERIFVHAREYMASTGNPYQWGHNNWPPISEIEKDIEEGVSYVVRNDGEVIATFCFKHGVEIDPCYKRIEGEGWLYDGPYGVIHRIATNVHGLGVLSKVIEYVKEKVPHIRIDTHEDNKVMIHLLNRLGFSYRGIIYVEHDDAPRLAFEL